MPVLDGNFEAFVTNLGKYNEGALVGEWVKFPTTEEEMKKVFERIGIGSLDDFGNPYEEWFITDYECPIYGVQKMLGEYESLDKLNYLAARIEELSTWEQEQFVAIMEAGCDEVSDIDDLINLTYNLDCYDFIPKITDEYDLGYYYVHEAGIYSEKELGPLANYIDYDRFGHDIAYDEQGRFTDEGYVRNTGDRWNHYFDGSLDDIPDEYRITGSGSERESRMTVLVVEPGKEPYAKEIDTGLESLQHEVGGDIQAVYPFEEPVALICNEEGKLMGMPLNRALRDEDGDIYDIVAGTFLVVGLTEDSFGSLSPELMEKFTDHFKAPEQFARLGDKIVAIPMISEVQKQQEQTEQKDFQINMDSTGVELVSRSGTWRAINSKEIDGHTFYLMQHEMDSENNPCMIVDEKGDVAIAEVYDGFDDHTILLLELAVMPVERMPDETISMDEMMDYGYKWGGMLPLREDAAAELVNNHEVFRLYADDSEGLVVNPAEIKAHAEQGGIFGIEKSAWIAALEKENYLKAAEMSMEDDYGMIDGIINNGPKEEKAAEVKPTERGEKTSIMDRLKTAKAEKPQRECPPPQKHKGEIDL